MRRYGLTGRIIMRRGKGISLAHNFQFQGFKIHNRMIQTGEKSSLRQNTLLATDL